MVNRECEHDDIPRFGKVKLRTIDVEQVSKNPQLIVKPQEIKSKSYQVLNCEVVQTKEVQTMEYICEK